MNWEFKASLSHLVYVVAGVLYVFVALQMGRWAYGLSYFVEQPSPIVQRKTCVRVAVEQFKAMDKDDKYGRLKTKALYRCSDDTTENKEWDGHWTVEQLNQKVWAE